MGADATVYESIDPSVTSKFVGYEHLEYESKITVLTTEDEIVDALSDGERGTIFVDETPFYATSGGQEADHGVIKCGDGEFVVEDVKKMLGGKIGHIGYMAKGMMKVGDQVTLTVDSQRRVLCARNHSATHLFPESTPYRTWYTCRTVRILCRRQETSFRLFSFLCNDTGRTAESRRYGK